MSNYEYLGCHPAIVWLGTDELKKIVTKHSAIRVEQLHSLPFAIRDGEYYTDPARSNAVTIFHKDQDTNKKYIIGVKSASKGCEVWIQTYYHIDATKAQRRKTKSKLIYVRK